MSEPAPALPPLQQALLDPATVEALFRDLAACTRILSVLGRSPGAGRGGEPPSLPLEAAHAGLADGSLRSVQVRYAYDGATWCDTLMAAPGGVRIVRIRDQDIGASLGQG